MTSSGAIARRGTFAFTSFASFALLVFACAKGTDNVDIGDGGITPAEDAGADLRPRFDSAPPEDDGSTPEEDSGSSCTKNVVINELAPSATAGAAIEFVELYNGGSCAAAIGGWKLPYKSKTGTGNTVLFNFEVGTSIPAKGFFVLGTPTFPGTKDAEMNVGMADEGQIALLDEQSKVVDAVAYGATTGPYVEGSAAPQAPANGSIGRKSDGVDTNDNKADFKTFTAHSAGAAN